MLIRFLMYMMHDASLNPALDDISFRDVAPPAMAFSTAMCLPAGLSSLFTMFSTSRDNMARLPRKSLETHSLYESHWAMAWYSGIPPSVRYSMTLSMSLMFGWNSAHSE